MDTLSIKLFEIFSLPYMFSVICGSYFIIKMVDFLNGEAKVPCWLKRTITFFVGALLFGVFVAYTDTSCECLISSYFCAVFTYDAAIKVLIKKFGIDYKKDASDD